MLILASWISFVMLSLVSFLFHYFMYFICFPMLQSSPYSNVRIRQVSYSLSLTLISFFPTWNYAPVALISVLITLYFLVNLSIDISSFLICWLQLLDTSKYLFLELFLLLLFLLLLLLVPSSGSILFLIAYIIVLFNLSFYNSAWIFCCYLLFLLLLYYP